MSKLFKLHPQPSSILLLGILLFFSALSSAPPAGAAGKGPVNIGWTTWSSGEAATHLVKKILEEKMGYEVELIMSSVELMYQNLTDGKIDFMLMSWLPITQQSYYQRVCGQVADLGPLYLHVRYGWLVPDYIPGDQLDSIEDLKKPEVAKKLGYTIQGINPGAELMKLSEKAIKDYGLGDYRLIFSTEAGMTSDLARAQQRKEWIVITGYSPNWIFGKWKLRYLKDPKGNLGGSERVNILARKGFYQQYPEVVAFLCRLFLPLPDLEKMMFIASETTYEHAAEEYIHSHPKLVRYWVTGQID